MAGEPDGMPRTFGPYRLLRRLGRGGMAEVLLARQDLLEGTSRLVAVKRVLPTLAADEAFVGMFEDEARIALGLSHPGIGHVLDVGRVEGRPYLAMEFIPGRNLEEAFSAASRRGEGVPLPIALEVARRVAEALDYAHRRTDPAGRPLGLVHRDVSPDNVILAFDGSVKLVDFGIALARGRLSRTRAGILKGKPAYMAPEQILGETVDARTDVFGLGVLLYRAVTGVHPFAAKGPEQIFRRILHEAPPAPHRRAGEVPLDLSRAVMRALARAPEDRFPDARAFGDALDRVLAERGWIVSPKRISGWLAGLFPEAVAAGARLDADPADTGAAVTACYLGETAEEAGGTAAALDDGPVPWVATAPGVPAGAPAPFAEAPVTRAATVAARLGPAAAEAAAPAPASDVWSLAEHWRHLPPAWRSLPAVAALAAFAGALLALAVKGALAWLST